MKLKTLAILLALSSGALYAQTVDVKDAWARATVPGQKATGAFMKITAKDGAKLVGVSLAVAPGRACYIPVLHAPPQAQGDLLGGLDGPAADAPKPIPSAEILARLKPLLPELSWVTVYETGSSGANFNGQSYRIWKEMTLDSAVRLRAAPAGPLRQHRRGEPDCRRRGRCSAVRRHRDP